MFSSVGNLFSFCKDVCMAFPETLGVYYSTTLPELAGSEAVDACSGWEHWLLQKPLID